MLQPYLDERYGQSSAPEAARIPSPIQLNSNLDFSHACQDQESCIHQPTVPATAPYNDCLVPVVLGSHPLAQPRSSELQVGTRHAFLSQILTIPSKQHIPTSSHFTNKSGEFSLPGYQDVPLSSCHPVHAVEIFPPAGRPNALGVALSSTFHTKRLDSLNAVANQPTIDLVSKVREGWRSPTEWMCAAPNGAQIHEMGPSSSSSQKALMQYDSQNITSEVLYLSHSAQFSTPRLYQNHIPMSENLNSLATWDSSYLVQKSASAEPSPAIRAFIEASPVPPTPLQNESVNVVAAKKENRCSHCGIHFTQPQVLTRHMKDKHEDKGTCSHCPSFKWSRGRPHLYRKHLRVKHSSVAFLEDSPGGVRKAKVRRTPRASYCKTLNKKTQVTSTGTSLVPDPQWEVHSFLSNTIDCPRSE